MSDLGDLTNWVVSKYFVLRNSRTQHCAFQLLLFFYNITSREFDQSFSYVYEETLRVKEPGSTRVQRTKPLQFERYRRTLEEHTRFSAAVPVLVRVVGIAEAGKRQRA